MRYFKWGIARIVLETSIAGNQPHIVPLFIEGFQNVMHESRTFPRFLPRIGRKVKCTYGEPIDDEKVKVYVDRWRALLVKSAEVGKCSIEEVSVDMIDEEEADTIRQDLTKVIRDAVVKVRESAGYPPEHPLAHLAEFYDSQEGLKYDELSGIPRPEIFNQSKRRKKQKVWEKEGPT